METNNEKLIQLMADYRINHQQLAKILMLSPGYVRAFTITKKTSTRHRNFTNRNLSETPPIVTY